jgi:antitoxin component HigA of HigAB toxin-antitoxin module
MKFPSRSTPLPAIRSATEYDAAAAIVDELSVRDEGTLSAGEQDYLDALTILIEAYDRHHFDIGIDPRTPVQKLRSLMESSGMSPSQLGDILGSRPVATMILKGQRALNTAQMRRLGKHFKIAPGFFV